MNKHILQNFVSIVKYLYIVHIFSKKIQEEFNYTKIESEI